MGKLDIAIIISSRYHKYMEKIEQRRIKELLDRLSRISAADEWGEDINPTQWTALSYLARANRFSRSPSQVSDFMTATRGTVSQTLKALARKELIAEVRSEHDKRSISYSITDKGKALLQKTSTIENAVMQLNNEETSSLLCGLETLVHNALKYRGFRAFGVCETCEHHRKQESQTGFCNLLNVPLSPAETKQICHEYSEAI
jgi:DNA-binding MarR family transcriptional regulator